MRPLNLNTLYMFDAAARHLNFRQAAEELNLTQGAVAQRIRALEDDLKIKFFERQPRGLALTQTGKRYHHVIRPALAQIIEATENLYPKNKLITLSVPPSFAMKWLVPRLGAFRQTHPDIDLHTIASETLADFQTDGIAIAIRQGCPPFGPDIVFQPLAPLALCAVCSPNNPIQNKTFQSIKDFTEHPLIEDSHHHWQGLFTAHEVKRPARMLHFNQTALAMDAAANGEGIALVPKLLLHHDLAKEALVRIRQFPETDQTGFYILWSKNKHQNSIHLSVINWIISEIKTQTGVSPPPVAGKTV